MMHASAATEGPGPSATVDLTPSTPHPNVTTNRVVCARGCAWHFDVSRGAGSPRCTASSRTELAQAYLIKGPRAPPCP